MKTNVPDCNIVHRRARGCGKRHRLVFVVIFRGNYLIRQGTQIDDGVAALDYAKEKGYSVRIWPMYGLLHFWELSNAVKEEIASFIKGLR